MVENGWKYEEGRAMIVNGPVFDDGPRQCSIRNTKKSPAGERNIPEPVLKTVQREFSQAFWGSFHGDPSESHQQMVKIEHAAFAIGPVVHYGNSECLTPIYVL